ncbi:MAG: MerR family transcriptional regulator [Sandaracinus sp.]|nr:MerR family transcriptional regulator [Sandaracinus sp.]
MNEPTDNVIHVVFGSDGGYRITTPDPLEEILEPAAPPSSGSGRPADPLADLYSVAEVARLFDLGESRLRSWARQGFLAPSVRRGRRRFYTFQDLIGVRVAKGLLDAGMSTREVQQSVGAIRDALPKVIRPLAELRVVAEGRAMVVHDEHGGFEPITGQRVIDFSVESLRDDVVATLRPEPSEASRRNAYMAYLEGCRLDEDQSTMDDAEAAYREALRLDPTFVSAMTNLGNLRYRRGDEKSAMALYETVLELDPNQPEAHYNLGFIRYERGLSAEALPYFERAVALDPGFADAHFNLAACLEELGRRPEARGHWRTYLELEPDSSWAAVARERLV